MLPAAFSTSATTWKQPKRQQVEERGKKCGAYINGTLFIKKKIHRGLSNGSNVGGPGGHDAQWSKTEKANAKWPYILWNLEKKNSW